MSGAEAGFVIGIISGLISIIQATEKIYEAAKDAKGQPDAFRQVAARLPLIVRILQNAKVKLLTLDETEQEAQEELLKSLKDKAETLKEIFHKVVRKDDDEWYERYRKLARTVLKGKEVEKLMGDILKDVQVLASERLIGIATEDEKKEIEKEVEHMNQMPSSLGEERGPVTQNHQGSGNNIANTGDGPVHMGHGDINQNHIQGDAYFAQNYTNHNAFHVIRHRVDLSFRKPIGRRLDRAPYLPPELFVGRETQLEEMHRKLGAANTTTRLVLGGKGGIGKTQLALAYAHRYRNMYESVIWVNATSEATLMDGFQSTASQILDTQDSNSLTNEQVTAGMKEWLADPQNTKWLLIFDNYDDPKSYNLHAYHPQTTHGAIIITTRLPDEVGINPLQVPPLDDIEDSLRILQKRSERENVKDDIHARRLAERLAGLPLALVSAGALLHKDRSYWTFEHYLSMYDEQFNIGLWSSLELIDYHRDRSLYTTWNLSFKHLQTRSPEAAQMLKLLAYFGHQSIWFELISAGRHDSVPDWLLTITSDSTKFDELMRLLIKYCFIEVQSGSQAYAMHTCVHDWTLACLNAQVESWSYWYAFDCVASSIKDEDWNLLDHVQYARFSLHAARLMAARFDGIRLELTQSHTGEAESIATLLKRQGQFSPAGLLLANTLVVKQTALGAEDPSTLRTIHNLGTLYRTQGKLTEAEEMCNRALAGCEKVLGPNHTSTLQMIHNLGTLYQDQGKLTEAEEMYNRALAGYEKVLGPNHTSTLQTIGNLGILYRTQGKLTEAEEMCNRALAGCEKALGPDHPLTLQMVSNLGALYQDQGKLTEAEEMYNRALAGKEKALGPDHPSTLQMVSNLGILYWIQGKLTEAEEMYNRAMAGKEKALGPDHPSTLQTVGNLGILYRNQGKLTEAEEMYNRALAGKEKALGPDHPSTLQMVSNLGALYWIQGKLKEAEEMYNRAMAGKEKALGPDHPSTLQTIGNLGILYQDQEKLTEAEEMYKRALAGHEEALGPDHSLTLQTIGNLGILYATQRKLPEAERFLQRAATGMQKMYGANHHGTKKLLRNLENLKLDMDLE